MEYIKWAGLIYKGLDFSDKFEISNKGEIRNKYSQRISKPIKKYQVEYCILSYKNKSYRIRIKEAQIESKIKDSETVTLTNADMELINKLVEDRIKEILESR